MSHHFTWNFLCEAIRIAKGTLWHCQLLIDQAKAYGGAGPLEPNLLSKSLFHAAVPFLSAICLEQISAAGR